MAAHATLSSQRQDWLTPPWFLGLVRAVGAIALDPATAPNNPTGAASFYAQLSEEGADFAERMRALRHGRRWLGPCGLAGPWTRDGLAYVNPPYGAHLSGPVEPGYVHTKLDRKTGERIVTGIGRGWAERIAQDRGELVVLVPVRTETRWWRALHTWCDLALFWSSDEYGSRINFVHAVTGKTGEQSNLASTVFYRGHRPHRFAEVFGPHGRLIPGELAMERFTRPRRRARDVEQLEREPRRARSLDAVFRTIQSEEREQLLLL